MALPVFLFYLLFRYIPMIGTVMAFQKFNIAKGLFGSPWIGFNNFITFFNSYYFARLMRNTVLISLADLLFNFPAPIIFALLLNEVNRKWFKKAVQTISYMPYFVSIVVLCGLVIDFCEAGGVISNIASIFLGDQVNLLSKPEYFRTIFVASNIWQGLGYGSIVYIAALTNVDQELYEAAVIDGAGRWKQTLHVTIPSIVPTIVILLILRMGSILDVGYEKVMLLYNPATYETADVISTFVYRKGFVDYDYGYSTAVGLFNSVINLCLLTLTNLISRKVGEVSLF
ncbi:MAG: sugar ABC transporter permease [Oscillospiraceae bacterium]|nr:sugar ABC transporter permease [Oscillospiraceae bacterium]